MAKIIAVTGKGGTGKTLVSALIVRHLKKHTPGPILALDADPDANLATVLAIPVDQTVGDLREETAKEIKDLPLGMSKSHYIEAGLHQVVVETEKVDLITMGRTEGPGCYCYVNNLLRDFSDKLQASYRWIVIDNEAGLEHLSRRTAARIDHLVAIVNDNPLSLDCARRIEEVTNDLKHGVGHKWVLINNVNGRERIDRVKERVDGLGMDLLGVLPYDEALDRIVFEQGSVLDLESGPAVDVIEDLMKKMEG